MNNYSYIVGGDTVKNNNVILSEKKLFDLAELFKVFGDSTRIKILYELSKGEMNVSDIALALNMNQSAISHQLKVLRDLNLVKFERQGKLVIYSLDDSHVLELFEQGLDHVKHK